MEPIDPLQYGSSFFCHVSFGISTVPTFNFSLSSVSPSVKKKKNPKQLKNVHNFYFIQE